MENAILKSEVINLKIMELSKELVQKQTEETFAPKCIQIETGSLFLRGCADGIYHCEVMEKPLYVSTSLGYHEVMIKGNKTRVKVEITLVFIKDTPYSTIYDGSTCCYVAMEEAGEITYMPYEKFLDWIVQKVQLQKE